MTLVSVIVPFRDASPYIEKCIQALLRQSLAPEEYEILAVDNGSTDGSDEIVRRFPRVAMVREEKPGSYAARNRALREARGEILAFTDADCEPEPDWLAEAVRELEDPEARLVLGPRLFARDSLPLRLLAAYDHEKHDHIFHGQAAKSYYGHTNNMAVRREVFDALGPFVECPRGADTILVRRCVDRFSCDSVRYLPDMRVRHMEIDRLSRLYRKFFLYGASSRRCQLETSLVTLGVGDRMRVFRRAAARGGYSPVESALCLGLLSGGLVCWWAGRLSATS